MAVPNISSIATLVFTTTAIAAVTQGLCAAGAVTVRPPFNQDDNDAHVLVIDYQPEAHVLMRGPVAFDFDGEVTL